VSTFCSPLICPGLFFGIVSRMRSERSPTVRPLPFDVNVSPLSVGAAMARDEGCPNQTKQTDVLLRAFRDRLLKPRVVASRRHAEDAAHRLRAVPVSCALMNS
jgi:hypothetical protein